MTTKEKTGRDYQDAFGRELGSEMFADGLPWDDAQAKFNKFNADQVEQLSKELDELRPKAERADELSKENERLSADLKTATEKNDSLSKENEELSNKLGVARKELGESTPPGGGPEGEAGDGKKKFGFINRVGRN